MRPTIRRANPADAVAVTGCQTACWREAYAGLVADDYLYSTGIEARRLDRWRERLGGSRAVWLAEDDAEVVGVASAVGTPVELGSLYVRRASWGSGLGSRLLTAAIGTGPASLWVFADNVRARHFYARHGFAVDGAEQVDPDTGLLEVRMVRGQIDPRGTIHSHG